MANFYSRFARLPAVQLNIHHPKNNLCTKVKCASEHVRILPSQLLDRADNSQDPLPNKALNTAYDQLVSRISAQVFNKRSLKDHDTFIIDNSLKLPADIFYALQRGQWFDCWVIKIAMHIADRPAFIHFCESIPVDDIGRHGRMRSSKRPFQGWMKKIAELRRKAELGPEGHHTPLIFTLLQAPASKTHRAYHPPSIPCEKPPTLSEEFLLSL